MKRNHGSFRKYEDYGFHGPSYYIDMTRTFSKKFVNRMKKMKQKTPLLERHHNPKLGL